MVKRFKQFNESHKDIHSICAEHSIMNYKINDDGSIDVKGNVNLSSRVLKEIPLKFRNVTGSFYCEYNQLKSLEGCPEYVGFNFLCGNNKLVSLKGSPKTVGGYFDCDSNQLVSLEGSPKTVGGYFFCRRNQLKSLEYISDFKVSLQFGINPIYGWWNMVKVKSKDG